jgi:serine kinase of HPr protein (carbohydrate metabolism regulator)
MAAPLPPPATIHASCIAIGTRGLLLVGGSGAGKSDLALRLIDRGAVLVADDRCELFDQRGTLFCRPPELLAGKLEVRGLGIVTRPWTAPVPVVLAVRLTDRYERLPEAYYEEVAGRTMPAVRIAPFEVAAPLKVELALERLSA